MAAITPNEGITKQVVDRIRQLRNERHWSTQKLAERCVVGDASISRSTLAKLESGNRRFITLDELEMLAAAFELTPEDLLRDAAGRATSGKILIGPPRNPWFTGRVAHLEHARASLIESGLHVLHGREGVGKTALAIEYMHRFSVHYDLLWWVPARSEEMLKAQLGQMAVTLGWAAEEMNLSLRLREVRRHLLNIDNWLLVLDGLKLPAGYARVLTHDTGHVLITSSDGIERDWSDLGAVSTVDSLIPEEAISYLQTRIPSLPRARALDLATRYGGTAAQLAALANRTERSTRPAIEAAGVGITTQRRHPVPDGMGYRVTLTRQPDRPDNANVHIALILLDRDSCVLSGSLYNCVLHLNDRSEDASTTRREIDNGEIIYVELERVDGLVAEIAFVLYYQPKAGQGRVLSCRVDIETLQTGKDPLPIAGYTPDEVSRHLTDHLAILGGRFQRGTTNDWRYLQLDEPAKDLAEIGARYGIQFARPQED